VNCAVVLDAFSRRVVGWSIDSSQTANQVVNGLGSRAIENRQAEGVVIHSDHGTQLHLLSVHAPRARLRALAINGIDRRSLRQRPDGILLGQDAGRATQPHQRNRQCEPDGLRFTKLAVVDPPQFAANLWTIL
jgi:hypothetical protein